MLILMLSFAAYIFALAKRPLVYAGLALQTIYIISRGFELGRIPLVGPHDTLVFLSASIVVFFIVFRLVLKEHLPFHNATVIAAAVFTAGALSAKAHNMPLPPVLKTFWFEIHVVLAFLSYALFGIAAILGYLYIRKKENRLEGLQYRAILVGYCLFSMSMIFGGIWAYLAWGTYWMWTPKELWTSILWSFYSLYLHARLRQWWTGRPLAYLSIAGFIVVMFTYLGVSLLMKSSHSF
ncbi:MAG TPA: cytochrome C biogenesis protein ResC [Nitrospirae bacterium]|nr:cytochrome C biogenesis protein ResC [Nitrospirota bacterium]